VRAAGEWTERTRGSHLSRAAFALSTLGQRALQSGTCPRDDRRLRPGGERAAARVTAATGISCRAPPSRELLSPAWPNVGRRARNRGVGAATKDGFAEALRRGAAVCVKMDGDGQMSADDLDALVAPVVNGSADYAKGNRFVDLAALRRMPGRRLFGNAMLSF